MDGSWSSLRAQRQNSLAGEGKHGRGNDNLEKMATKKRAHSLVQTPDIVSEAWAGGNCLLR